MCGIFGIISDRPIKFKELRRLALHSERRGKDSSGLLTGCLSGYKLYRSNTPITSLLKDVQKDYFNFVIGHSRLITNGMMDNQPVYRDGVAVIHNGVIINHESLWNRVGKVRRQEIDTEIIAAIVGEHLENGGSVNKIAEVVLTMCRGIVACAVAVPRIGKVFLFSNNGSLFYCKTDNGYYFASERFSLNDLNADSVIQVSRNGVVLNIPSFCGEPTNNERVDRIANLIPTLGSDHVEEAILEFRPFAGRRCSCCILPETMPFITFNDAGICNFCNNYKKRNSPRPLDDLVNLLKPYRRSNGIDCIVPFSGGRDSCYTLHVIVNELKLNAITYTYDWGMVTDLGRRNISRMCDQLGIENIVVAADIKKKRDNIRKNLIAWLKSPELGMLSVLTSGDKHFFRYIENLKRETGIQLNIWGINPLEVTHFKSGFLGVKPDFLMDKVYSSGPMKQVEYQWLRLKSMIRSPGYFNSSLFDTLSGEYYRSCMKKTDYYHLFDYFRWDENVINDTLLNKYDWEIAPDTTSTWRIGDGTAAFYNYVYHTVAGFTEHDTFRSNQVREGEISREKALELVKVENRPRYQNIKWYLDAVGLDYVPVINTINSIKKIYTIE